MKESITHYLLFPTFKNSSNVQNTSLQSTNRTPGSKALTKVSKIRVSTTKEKIVDYGAASKGTADVEATRMGDNGTAQENNTQVAGANKSATTTNTKKNQTSISTKLEVDELESNNIAYVEINGTLRYTLVKEIENNTIFLSDPALGNIEMNKEDFTKIYSGYALVVSNPYEFYEINQDLTTFSETSEVKHAQFTESYENLKQSLSNLDDAYLTEDETKISDALVEYNNSVRNFTDAKDQLISLEEEERELSDRIISFIEEGVSSGIYSHELLDEAEKNNESVINSSEELSVKLADLSDSLKNNNTEQLQSSISSLDEYLSEMNQNSQSDINSLIINSITDLNLTSEETVNPDVTNTLDEIEKNINDSKEELNKIELIYGELLNIKDDNINLTSLENELNSIKEKTEKNASNDDVTSVTLIENSLSELLIRIDTEIKSNVGLVSNSTSKLQNIQTDLQNLYKLTTHIDEISPEYNQRSVILKQDISNVLDRIDADFRYTWYCWYLLGETDKELKDTENELKGIEQNLKAGKKENQNVINETKNLETSSSDLRTFISTKRGEIKGLAQELRHVGTGWVKVYREFVDLIPATTIDPVYLNETTDAQITPEIKQKALELGNDPTQIYNYVQNLSYDTYYGSSRGSVWTMSGGSGNDFDKSSLLVALLRAAGYPARYVQGWVQMDYHTLIGIEGENSTVNGTSCAMTIDQALNVLQANGIPYEKNETTVSLEHVWVEVAMPSNVTKETTKWSFEDYNFEDMNLNQVDIPAVRSIQEVQESYYWLPLDPSFSNYTVLQSLNYPEIPDELRHKVQIKTSDGINSGLIPLPLLAKEKITLMYKPADEAQVNFLEDQSLYRLLDNGGKSWYVGYQWGSFWWTGPYYAYVVPELIIGNQTVSTGNAVSLGSKQTLYYNFTNANQRSIEDVKSYTAGDMYAITLSPAYEPSSRITEEASKTVGLKTGIRSDR